MSSCAEGPAQDIARVTFVGLPVRRDDVAIMRATFVSFSRQGMSWKVRVGDATMSDSSMASKP